MALPQRSSRRIPYDQIEDIIAKKHTHLGKKVASQDDFEWLEEIALANDITVEKALLALKNWGTLTVAQKDKVLKFLLAFYLVAAQRLFLFKLEKGG